MIWPFHRFRDHRSEERPSRPSADASPPPRTWRLLQVESALACNLACIMCPWRAEAGRSDGAGLMDDRVWAAIRPWLSEVDVLDFTGGGEPLLQPHLADWIRDAAGAGCRPGLLTNGTLLDADRRQALVEAGLDWIGFSLDGATADVYEAVRPGADFRTVCDRIAGMAALKQHGRPRVMLNFVMMTVNIHQLSDMVALADALGVDRLTLKQCDVIRPANRTRLELYDRHRSRAVRDHGKALQKARRLAERRGLELATFAFQPDELPVCAQDPVHSLFVARDGRVAPCIGLAYGGDTRFFGEPATMPPLVFGRLPDPDLMTIWQSTAYAEFRQRFGQREAAYSTVLARSQFEPSLIKLEEAFTAARDAMPRAPEPCRICHYLYGV